MFAENRTKREFVIAGYEQIDLFKDGFFSRSCDCWFLTCRYRVSPAEGDLYFTTKLQNYTAVERDEVKLVCELSKSTADVKWFKDGKDITPSKTIAISTDGKKRILTVRKADKANIGEYTCDCGSDKTTANLNIEGKL